jgi:hypothetical protein
MGSRTRHYLNNRPRDTVSAAPLFSPARMPGTGRDDVHPPVNQVDMNLRTTARQVAVRPPVAITSPIASGLTNSPSRRHRQTRSPTSILLRATSPTPTVHEAQSIINMVHEVPASITTRYAAASVPSTRASDLGVDSIVLPRIRPNNPAARDPYARNNDFLIRMASVERLESEIARLQRPTPPPAIGHGRPTSGSSEFVAAPQGRSHSRPVPRWQQDQENSEEAAMSVLQEDMRSMYLRQEFERETEDDRGVMDNTPPKESRIGRYLRE